MSCYLGNAVSVLAGSWLPSDRRRMLWYRRWSARRRHLKRSRNRMCDCWTRSERRMMPTSRSARIVIVFVNLFKLHEVVMKLSVHTNLAV